MNFDELILKNCKVISFGRNEIKICCAFLIIYCIIFLLYIDDFRLIECEESNVTVAEAVTVKWDTLDGIGYQFTEKDPPPFDLRYLKLSKLPLCGNLTNDVVQQEVIELISIVTKDFFECITPIVTSMKGQAHRMGMEWVAQIGICNQLSIFDYLELEPINGYLRTYWTVLPRCKEENVLVTVGVGHNIAGELSLNGTIPNTTFFGTDPIFDPNRQLYSSLGKFFPFALGNEPGFTMQRVLPNQKQGTKETVFQDVLTIPFGYFLNDILKLKKVDFVWIDIDGGEFPLFESFNDAIICQLNIEVHPMYDPTGAEMFHNFIFKILESQHYIFLKSMQAGVGVYRMFFLNVKDKECLIKYFNIVHRNQ